MVWPDKDESYRCSSEFKIPGTNWSLRCDRPAGHDGGHEASVEEILRDDETCLCKRTHTTKWSMK